MLLGNIVATLVPYFRKQYEASLEEKSFEFDLMYIYNTIVAALVQFIFALPVMVIIETVNGFTEITGLIIVSFAYGYGGNKAQLEGAKVYQTVKTFLSLRDQTITSD